MIIAEVESSDSIDHMFLRDKLTESDRHIAFVHKFLYLCMSIKTLFCLTRIIELGMERRQAHLLVIVLLGQAELRPEAQVFGYKPLQDEIVSEAESCCSIPVVQMGIPQRIGDRIVIHAFFRIVEILVDASVPIVFPVVWIGMGVFGKGHCRVGDIEPVDGKLVAELELSGAIDQVHIPFKCLSVRIFHHTTDIAVAQADAISDLILASFGIYVMLMSESRAYGLAEPICVHSPLDLLQTLIAEIVKSDLGKRVACVVLVYARQCLEPKLFARVHQVVVAKVCK